MSISSDFLFFIGCIYVYCNFSEIDVIFYMAAYMAHVAQRFTYVQVLGHPFGPCNTVT